MAIAAMAKVMIVSHRTQASELLEVIQREGICQILNTEASVVGKEWPELAGAVEKPKEIEVLLGRYKKCLAYLEEYAQLPSGLGAALAPRVVVEQSAYDDVIGDKKMLDVLEECERIELELERLVTERENIEVTLADLAPWRSLESPVEELYELETTACLVGLIPNQNYEQAIEPIGELGGVIEHFGLTKNRYACLVFCFKEDVVKIQKLLRSFDFEQTGFEHLSGTVTELREEYGEKLVRVKEQIQEHRESLKNLADNYLNLQILHDHYLNLLSREQTKSSAPSTEQTVVLEGWVREKDYSRLEEVVSGFSASSLNRLEPVEDEDVPVEIENRGIIKPFEVVTRLYGMPQHYEIDPTALLTPFFAIFFALCLTDAGYGLIIICLTAYFIKKMQADKKLLWLLLFCSVVTLGAGALTGGWFGDAAQQLSVIFGWKWLADARLAMMWFDPLKKPMTFFALSISLGYIHIMVGLIAAFVHNLNRKKIVAAVCDQLTWLVMLNCIVLKLFGGKIGLSPGVTSVFGIIAMFPAVSIVLFSQRHGGWGGRIGMGCYELFSTIFYMGDVLSYLRLMALGMVTGGLGMAINVMAKTASEVPYVGFILMIVVLVGGHMFNTAISGLSAFVHTIRLQFVEFFPKFLEGGGTLFMPLAREYKYVYLKEKAS